MKLEIEKEKHIPSGDRSSTIERKIESMEFVTIAGMIEFLKSNKCTIPSSKHYHRRSSFLNHNDLNKDGGLKMRP